MTNTTIKQMLKYESYKDSGTEWLGMVPLNWNVVRMNFLFKDLSEKNRPSAELLSVTQDKGVVPRSWVENRMVMPSGNLESFKFIEKGDFAISLRSFEGGLEYCHHDGIISPAYTVLKKNKQNLLPAYYRYLFKSQAFISELQTSVVGIREGKNISYEELKNSFLPVPSKSDQTEIAHFLDQKTAQIDEAIAIKQKQIALLKERKQIIIQQAVTQGLKSNSALVETDLIWAPKIASHWSLLPNRLFLKIRRVPVGSAYKNYQMLSLTKKGVLIRDLSKGAGKQSDFLERMQEVRKGDFIFCLFDVEETPRTVGLSKHLGMISADYTIFECNDKYTGRFLEYYYKSMDDQKLLKPLYKGLRNRIPKPRFLRTNCPMPPKDELIEIVMYLDTLEEKTTRSIEIILSQIKKLKEYRTTLINSAVTGKIKVTELA